MQSNSGSYFLNFGAADFFLKTWWKWNVYTGKYSNLKCTAPEIFTERTHPYNQHPGQETENDQPRRHPLTPSASPSSSAPRPHPRATTLQTSNSTGWSCPLWNLLWTYSLIRQCVYLASLFSTTLVRFTHVVRRGGGLFLSIGFQYFGVWVCHGRPTLLSLGGCLFSVWGHKVYTQEWDCGVIGFVYVQYQSMGSNTFPECFCCFTFRPAAWQRSPGAAF